MKKSSFVVLLVVGATVLGATVLREPIANAAQATSAASSPTGKRFDAATQGFGLHLTFMLTKRWQVLPPDTGGPPSARRSQWFGWERHPPTSLSGGALTS